MLQTKDRIAECIKYQNDKRVDSYLKTHKVAKSGGMEKDIPQK